MATPTDAASVRPITPSSPASIPELPLDATNEQKDEHWLKYVYQGDRMPQLTVRAVLMGGFLGMAMSAANLYTTLSIGWAFGVAITACVISFVMWTFVRFCSGKRVSQMSILENACMASTASAAGYSTGSTIATMFGALVLLAPIPEGQTTADMKTWEITAPWIVVTFTLCTGLMGVFLAIPMKRQQINHEQLPFPSGIAAAETLKSLYSQSKEAVLKAYVLLVGLAGGLLIGFLRAADDVIEQISVLGALFSKISFLRIPSEIELPLAGKLYSGRHPGGLAFEPSALLIAAGMIVGMRTSVSLVASSALLYFAVGPWLAQRDLAVMEQPAMMAMAAAKTATESLPAAPEVTDEAAIEAHLRKTAAALAAAAAGARSEKWDYPVDAADLTSAADNAATVVINAHRKQVKEFAAAQAKGGEHAAAATAPDTLAKLQERVAKSTISELAKAAGASAANAPGRAAASEARAKALAAGKPADQVEIEATVAFDAAKYKPEFIWSWTGGTVTITRWSLWGGTAVMVFASLTAVALQWRSIVRAFVGARASASEGASADSIARAKIEVPGSWMVIGMLPITIAMVWLQIQAFGVSWWAGIIAVAMSFVLSLVASRATGETDTTPIGAMGKVMQLLFAGLAPANINANLASAGIAANSASSSADLLTDLKTGYLLGANPRRQFLAQFFGVFFGTVAIVPIWYLMVPTREKLEQFALPSTRSWEAVARILTKGVGELPASAVYAILIGAAIGILLPCIERLLPPRLRGFMPSATGIGLAWVMPFQNAFSFFVGAVLAYLWTAFHKRSAENYNIPIASGLIAGESLMAAGLAISATIAGLMS